MKPSGFGIASAFASCGGYGLLMMTGIGHALNIAPDNQHFAAASLALGFGLITSGLIVATMGKLRRLMVPEASGLIGSAVAALALGHALQPAGGAGHSQVVFAGALLASMAMVVSIVIGRAEAYGERRMRLLIVPAYVSFTIGAGSVLYVLMADYTGIQMPVYNLLAMCALASVALFKLSIWIEADKLRPWSKDRGLKFRGVVVLCLVVAMIALLGAMALTGTAASVMTVCACLSTGIALAVDRWLTQRGAAMGLARSSGVVAEEGLPPEAKPAIPASTPAP